MSKTPKRLPSDLPQAKVLAAVRRLGFAFDREGSRHTVYKDPADPNRQIVLPRHSRIRKDLLHGILTGVGVSEEQFMAHY